VSAPRKKLSGCECGSAAIEFAFISPVLIALIFGVVEYGRFLWMRTTIEQGVESAARYGVFQNKLYNDKSIADWVTPTSTYAHSMLAGITHLTVTVTPSVVTVAGIGMIQVQAQYTFTPILQGITWGVPSTITVTARQPSQ
jgi:Flp pilus assembly protein TadG